MADTPSALPPLQQALHVLELVVPIVRRHSHEGFRAQVHDAIAACRAALAAKPEAAPCIGRDPTCPCQDGDPCHYRDAPGTKAWPVPALPEGWVAVLSERRRQINAEGWTSEHDDAHAEGDLALAAAAYSTRAALNQREQSEDDDPNECPTYWPWSPQWWKPGEPRRMLVKAGALILAEIERLDRAAASPIATSEESDDHA